MSKLVNKFNYVKLSRSSINGERRYLTPEKDKVPSVTTILAKTKSEEDKKELQQWKDWVGPVRSEQIKVEAGHRGTRLHKYIETYVETDVWPECGSNPYAKQSHKMATVIYNRALCHVDEIWGSEVSLYVPKLYAGTTDLVGVYKDSPCIMDFKQTNKPKKEKYVKDYYLQLVAYGLAHNELYETNINEGHIFMCSKNYEYQQFDIMSDDWDFWAKLWWDRVEQFYQKELEK